MLDLFSWIFSSFILTSENQKNIMRFLFKKVETNMRTRSKGNLYFLILILISIVPISVCNFVEVSVGSGSPKPKMNFAEVASASAPTSPKPKPKINYFVEGAVGSATASPKSKISFVDVASASASASPSKKINDESRLLTEILRDYDPRVRPILNSSEAVNLKIDLTFHQLLGVDEKNHYITTNIWLGLNWKDDFLKWNPAEFGNISDIRVSRSLLWRPDVNLYNMASDGKMSREGDFPDAVYSNGNISEVTPMVAKSSCIMDVTWFPFDKHTCLLRFGSWSRNGDLLNISVGVSEHPSEYVGNGEWSLLLAPGVRGMTWDRNVPYHTIIYAIHLRRRTLYYFFNLLVPCALIGFLALLGFTLPPESGEKLTLGVTVLFSLIVFLNMIAASMPANSEAVPLLGTYFNCVMFMIALSVVSTVVYNLNQRATNPKEIQGISRKLFLHWLPWILCIGVPQWNTSVSVAVAAAAVDQKSKDAKDRLHNHTIIQMARGNEPMELDIFNRDLDQGMDPDQVRKQWRFVAIVVDKFCLVLSVIITLISTAVLLISAL